MVQLSIISGTRNRPKPYARFARSVIERAQVDFELIIGDASDEPYTEYLPIPLKMGRLEVVRESPRLGYAKGLNALLKQASGEWVMILSDDVEVLAGFDTEALRFMEACPEIGIGALSYSDDLTREDFHTNQDWIGPYANFPILRREFGNEIGWFDEDLPQMYGQDNALSYKCYLAGKGIAAIPYARVIHHSENDSERLANNNGRDRDASLLKNKYWPLADQMRRAQTV